MVGTLGPAYSETIANLQSAINEALNGVENARAAGTGLTSVGTNLSLPTTPDANVTAPQKPTEPAIDFPGELSFSETDPSVAKPRFPSNPGVGATGSWGGPGRPTQPVQFKQFFTGTPDTPQEVISRANEAVDAWVGAYFPAINECFTEQPEQWICDVISGVRPLGNSEAAIDVAWVRAKANERNQLQSERASITSEFASRGFTLPLGAMVAQMRRSQERFSDAAAAVNREAALADVNVQAELLRLAVSTAADLKRGMASVMAQYFNTVAGVSDRVSETNNERARIVAGAEGQFLQALTSYESINQEYYRSLNGLKLDESRTRIEAYSAEVGAVSSASQADIQTARFQLESAQQRLTAAIAKSEAGNQSAQTKADVYRSSVSSYGTLVDAEVTKARLEVAKYEAVVTALINKAALSTGSGAGTAIAGAARAFGDIAAAAANASGPLIAQIEGL